MIKKNPNNSSKSLNIHVVYPCILSLYTKNSSIIRAIREIQPMTHIKLLSIIIYVTSLSISFVSVITMFINNFSINFQ